MARGKMVYICEAAHRRLKVLAARRNRPMGRIVEEMVRREEEELDNPWLTPEGHRLQEPALDQAWRNPVLDIYDDD